jgi:hypothetical protein
MYTSDDKVLKAAARSSDGNQCTTSFNDELRVDEAETRLCQRDKRAVLKVTDPALLLGE